MHSYIVVHINAQHIQKPPNLLISQLLILIQTEAQIQQEKLDTAPSHYIGQNKEYNHTLLHHSSNPHIHQEFISTIHKNLIKNDNCISISRVAAIAGCYPF